jgi:hypothetical protein
MCLVTCESTLPENYMLPRRCHPEPEPHHSQLTKGNPGMAASKSFGKMCFIFPTWPFALIFDIQTPLLASNPAGPSGLCMPRVFGRTFAACWELLTLTLLFILYISLTSCHSLLPLLQDLGNSLTSALMLLLLSWLTCPWIWYVTSPVVWKKLLSTEFYFE